MVEVNKEIKLQYISAISLFLIGVFDTIIPGQFVIDILYLSCTLMVFRQKTPVILAFCIASCLLILSNALFEHLINFSIITWSNRLIAIFAILATSYLAIQFRKLSDEAKVSEQKYYQAMEEMLFITSHKVRKPVANILALSNIIDSTDELNEHEIKAFGQLFCASAAELDDFTKELNSFLQAGQKNTNSTFAP